MPLKRTWTGAITDGEILDSYLRRFPSLPETLSEADDSVFYAMLKLVMINNLVTEVGTGPSNPLDKIFLGGGPGENMYNKNCKLPNIFLDGVWVVLNTDDTNKKCLSSSRKGLGKLKLRNFKMTVRLIASFKVADTNESSHFEAFLKVVKV